MPDLEGHLKEVGGGGKKGVSVQGLRTERAEFGKLSSIPLLGFTHNWIQREALVFLSPS